MEPVGVVKRCGHEYGVFPSVDLAENWHAALGRRPIVGARETQEVHTREVRLLLNHPSLFHRESSHLRAGSRTLAHARDACPSSLSLAAGTGQEATLVAAGLRTL